MKNTCLKAIIKTGIIDIFHEDIIIKKLRLLNRKSNEKLFLCKLKPVCSERQLKFAALAAFKAFKEKHEFSHSLEMEFVLRLCGTKRICPLVPIIQLTKGKNEIALVALAETKSKALKALNKAVKEFGFKEKKGLIAMNVRQNLSWLKKFYNVNEQELKALSDLKNPLDSAVLEKTALIALEE